MLVRINFLHLISSHPDFYWNLCKWSCPNHLTLIKLWQRLHSLAGVNVFYYYIIFRSKYSLFFLELFWRAFEQPSCCLSVYELRSLTGVSPGGLCTVAKFSPFRCNKRKAEAEHSWALFAGLCQVGVRLPLLCKHVLFVDMLKNV